MEEEEEEEVEEELGDSLFNRIFKITLNSELQLRFMQVF